MIILSIFNNLYKNSFLADKNSHTACNGCGFNLLQRNSYFGLNVFKLLTLNCGLGLSFLFEWTLSLYVALSLEFVSTLVKANLYSRESCLFIFAQAAVAHAHKKKLENPAMMWWKFFTFLHCFTWNFVAWIPDMSLISLAAAPSLTTNQNRSFNLAAAQTLTTNQNRSFFSAAAQTLIINQNRALFLTADQTLAQS